MRTTYIISFLLVIVALGAFVFSFENRKPQARELIVLAVMCAIASVSRIVCQPLPNFSPLIGFVIITGIVFGPQSGFLCGALSAFMSNMAMGQGPWTPWQMFAYGLAGLVAGFLYKKGWLSKEKIKLSIFGFLVIVLLIGPVLDISGIFIFPAGGQSGWLGIKALLISGFALNLVHGASVSLTLFFLSGPMFEKLERIQIKYGMMESEDEI